KNMTAISAEEFKPHFPPRITPGDIVEKLFTNNRHNIRTTRIPTAFDAYKLCFCREFEPRNYNFPEEMIQSLIINSWGKESANVKEEYKRLLNEAKAMRE
ncbi:7675_t:CDS:1, partial [Cetraspora pellucida]